MYEQPPFEQETTLEDFIEHEKSQQSANFNGGDSSLVTTTTTSRNNNDVGNYNSAVIKTQSMPPMIQLKVFVTSPWINL
jgi:hypothetical protein|eukprot:scaffold2074_cov165-Chaetoceros_neogracile.AAC.3